MQPLHGVLDMLVLRTLARQPLHGYGIAKAIQDLSTDTIGIEFGSLYPALKRIELKGWVASKWEVSEEGRKAKYYRLTATGRKKLQQEHAEWREFTAAVARIMGPVAEES